MADPEKVRVIKKLSWLTTVKQIRSFIVIWTGHKPLKSFKESTTENKKIQCWTTNIRGYNCRIKYIKGKKYVCADLLSCLPHNSSGDNCDDRGELSGPDITDKTFDINLINSSNINPKDYAQYDQHI